MDVLREDSFASWCMPTPNVFVPRLRANVSSIANITGPASNHGSISANTYGEAQIVAQPARPGERR
jgi:hypothetical protein